MARRRPRISISGRQHSRVEELRFDAATKDEFEAAAGGIEPFPSIVAAWADAARRLLRSRGLPDCERVFKARDTGNWVCDDAPDSSRVAGSQRLDYHVRQELRLPRDSAEDLAARIIVTAQELERADSERAREAAYRLGRLVTLASVYARETVQRKAAGGKDKRKEWADALAAELHDAAPGRHFHAHWRAIPKGGQGQFVAGWEVYRDGDMLCAANDATGKVQKIRKSTFRTEYWSRAKKIVE